MTNKKQILVMNGVHASGKTTIANLLRRAGLGFEFFPEIGDELRKSLSYNPMYAKEDYESVIMRKEVSRDAELQRSNLFPVVETWHTGNIAYLLTRNPAFFKVYEEAMKRQLELINPIGVIVLITKEKFRERIAKEHGLGDLSEFEKFFEEILKNTISTYKRFNIDYITLDNNDTPDVAANVLVETLAKKGIIRR